MQKRVAGRYQNDGLPALKSALATLCRCHETTHPSITEEPCTMEPTLPEDHPDMIRIVQAAHHDLAPVVQKKALSLSSALTSALGKVPGASEDLDNIKFLVHVLSVNRAAGAIDDDAFEQLLESISVNQRAILTICQR